MSRTQTEKGILHGASSIWTTLIRHEGLLGAPTTTGTETMLKATNLLLDILQNFKDSPPCVDEVQNAIEVWLRLDTCSPLSHFLRSSPGRCSTERMGFRLAGCSVTGKVYRKSALRVSHPWRENICTEIG